MNKSKIKRFTWNALCFLYFPVFLAAFLLHGVGRFIIAIAYFGLLEPKMGKNVLISIFHYGNERLLWRIN